MATKKKREFHDEEKEKLFCLAWLCESVLKLEDDLFAPEADKALRLIFITLLGISSDVSEEDAKAFLSPFGGTD